MMRGKFLTALLCGISGSALAAGAPEAPKINFMYNFGLTHDDDGLNSDSKTDVATSSIMTKAFRLIVTGKANDKVSYETRYNLLDSKFDYGFARLDLNKMMGVILGRNKVRTYGFDHRDGDPLSLYTAIGGDSDPFATESDMVAVELAVMGKITVQFVDDNALRSDDMQYKKSKTDAKGNKTAVDKNPAYVLEWLGKFGPIQPLIEFASYDLNHSNLWTIGAKFETKQIMTVADYTTHNQAYKGAQDATTKKSPEMKDVATRLNFAFEFNAGVATPFLHYSKFDLKQDTVSGTKERKTNTAGTFDDNGSDITLGATINKWGDSFMPYLTLDKMSGSFVNKNNNDADMSRMQTTLGVKGLF